jgi:hypothetical protein
MNFSSFNETIYPYIKIRQDFGRQPRFLRDHHRVHCNIHSNRLIRKKFRRYRLLDKGVQAVKHAAETPVSPFYGLSAQMRALEPRTNNTYLNFLSVDEHHPTPFHWCFLYARGGGLAERYQLERA